MRGALVGLAILVAAVIAYLALSGRGLDAQLLTRAPRVEPTATFAPARISGPVGSEKAGFFSDPRVKQRLTEVANLSVDFQRVGSLTIAEEDVRGKDFASPSNAYARDVFLRNHAGVLKSDTVFSSPMVVYTRKAILDALVAQGVAWEKDGALRLDPLKLTRLIESGKRWPDINQPVPNRQIILTTTRPTASSSGLLSAALFSIMLNDGTMPTEATVGPLLPRLRGFYAPQGNMQESTGNLFEQFMIQGIGGIPMMFGYESQIIEYANSGASNRQILAAQQVVVVYPEPTVWATHSLLALDEGGRRLVDAMTTDLVLQQLAVEHGFRRPNLAAPTAPDVKVAREIEAIDIPAAPVVEKIIEALR